jgi:hypothetical protein
VLSDTLLDRSPVWLIYAGTVLLLLAGNEIGYRIGVWRRTRMPEGEKAPATAIVGSTLGLLAFMLAFTFGMAGSRFDARKQLVLDEARPSCGRTSAPSSCEPQRSEVQPIAAGLCGAAGGRAEGAERFRAQELVTRSKGSRMRSGNRRGTLAERPSPSLSSSSSRSRADGPANAGACARRFGNRIPPAIVMTLYGIAFLALPATGYGAGLAESRTTVPRSCLLILTFAAIIVLIVDLERPRQSLFEVSQQPMADVVRRIQSFRP